MFDSIIWKIESNAHDLEIEWRKVGYDHDMFTELAVEFLKKLNLHQDITLASLLAWDLTTTEHERYRATGFGQPAIRLYSHSLFFIEALPWLESTTSIHEHSFSGAFQVLEGSSLQSRWRFIEESRMGRTMKIGDVTLRDWELLKAGDVRPIYQGVESAHALFHLQYPSLSLVIRTLGPSKGILQYDYVGRRLAIPFTSPVHSDSAVTNKYQQSLNTAYKTQSLDDFENLFESFIATRDEETILRTLFSISWLEELGKTKERLARLETMLNNRSITKNSNVILSALKDRYSDRDTLALRRRYQSAKHRLFFGMVNLIKSKSAILQAFAEFLPTDTPEVSLFDLLIDMIEISENGGAEILGVNIERDDDNPMISTPEEIWRAVLNAIILDNATDPSAFNNALEAHLPEQDVSQFSAEFEALRQMLQRSDYFGFLFNEEATPSVSSRAMDPARTLVNA